MEQLKGAYSTADGLSFRYQDFCDDVDSGLWLFRSFKLALSSVLVLVDAWFAVLVC
jgi:hypothetical protein